MNLFLFLIISGLILIIMEIFVPGGILGTIGFIFLVISLVMAFKLFGNKTGFYYSVSLLVFLTFLVVMVVSFAKYVPFREKIFLLYSQKGMKVENIYINELLNKEGIAHTMLRPSGKVKIEDKTYDAVSDGAFIEKGLEIVVYKIENNHLIVKKKS